MKKATHTILWVCSFLAISLFLAFHFPDSITSNHLPKYSTGTYLFDFQNRLDRYLKTPSDDIQAVIVGPSYVAQLEEIPSLHNLGLIAARPKECSALLKYCRKNDLVLFAISVRDFSLISRKAIVQDEARPEVISTPLRKIFILRESLRHISGLSNIIPRKPIVRNDDLAVIEHALNAGQSKSLNLERLVGQLRWYPVEAADVNLEIFHKIAEKQKNIVFVIFPIIPLNPVTSDTEIGRLINQLVAANSRLEQLFIESDLPFINLSSSLEPEHYSDLCHYVPEGKERLIKTLVDFVMYHPKQN